MVNPLLGREVRPDRVASLETGGQTSTILRIGEPNVHESPGHGARGWNVEWCEWTVLKNRWKRERFHREERRIPGEGIRFTVEM